MIFGYTEDKNKVEVPEKSETDKYLTDSGWVTLLEAGTYTDNGVSDDNTGASIVVSKAIKYRKIGNVVHVKGHISSVTFGTPYPFSVYTMGELNDDCVPNTSEGIEFIIGLGGSTAKPLVAFMVSTLNKRLILKPNILTGNMGDVAEKGYTLNNNSGSFHFSYLVD